MAFTPLTLTCVDYLSSNSGLSRKTVSSLRTYMAEYKKLSVISAINNLANPTNFRAVVKDTFPALLDAIPYFVITTPGQPIFDNFNINHSPTFDGASALPANQGLTQYILSVSAPILELANYSKLASAWGMANAHVTQINEVIKSVLASKVQNSTFAGNDAAMTSNIALVTTNIPKFAVDLEKTAELFANPTEPFSSPAKLLVKINDAKGLSFIRNTLIKNGLSDNEIDAVIAKEEINNNTLKNIYVAFGSVVKEELSAILDLLNIKTEKITSLQDLYNLKVMFPDSYTFLIAPTKNGSKSISKIVKDDLLIDVDFIIPQEYAVSLTAFSSSLQQIKGIADLKISAVVKTAKSLEDTSKLTSVSSATSAVSPSAKASLDSKYALGTGENNTLVFADVLGTSIGYSHDDLYKLLIVPMKKIDAVSSKLVQILNSPSSTVSQVTAAVTEIISNNPSLVKECNAITAKIAKRLSHEAKFQSDAKIVAASLQNSNTSVLQFAKSLHAIGNDKSVAGQRTVLEELVNSTAAGQTIIACMKEGQNIKQLQNNGLATDNFIKT